MTGVYTTYVEAITAAGGIPLLIPVPLAIEDSLELYRGANGLLLAGGEDIDPKEYGETKRLQCRAVSPERDSVELALTRRCLADRKPLLGICRGLQVLNVALGGTLYQDIAADYSTAIKHDSDRWRDLSHPISIEPKSRLASLFGTSEAVSVNSLHHQAIRDLAPGLTISARSPDGVIEAVEGQGSGYALGVQCHPETLWDRVDTRWEYLFRTFVEECLRAYP